MDSDFYSDIPNGKHGADSLDRALDDFVHGNRQRVNRLEDDMGSTIDQVFGLADVSGMPGTGAIRARPVRRLIRWPMKQVVSVASTLAAVIILAIGLNATVPHFRDQSAGLGTAVPTSDAEDDESMYSGVGLRADECDVTSRTRNEVIDILSVAPGAEAVSPGDGSRRDASSEIDTGVRESLRTIQACWKYGGYFDVLSLQSEQYIRRDLYGSDLIETPYTSSTLAELISGQEEIHANRSMVVPDATYPVTVADDSLSVSMDATGTTAFVEAQMVLDGRVINQDSIQMTFVFEDGRWRLWSTSQQFMY